MPSHREREPVIQHPGPIDTVVKLRRQPRNQRVIEMRPASEYATQEDRRIDGRHFSIQQRLARLAGKQGKILANFF